MKKILFIAIMLANGIAFAQDTAKNAGSNTYTIANAKEFMSARSAKYSPEKAYAIYQRLALQDNPEAMNAMGVMYNTGVGVTADPKQAFTWFTKAANANYGAAWYNLALMYKNGVQVAQSDQQAYDSFTKGTLLNYRMCWYGKGYMLYKGLGCLQDYTEAYQCFEKGVAQKDEGSMYMLGLCFRNGYGTAVNVDSARYWLAKAAAFNDNRAIKELADPSPENANLQDVPNLQPAASTPQAQNVNLKAGFKKVTNRIASSADLTGEYNGFVIKFDWSGKHIISQAALKLRLKRDDKQLSGDWTEDGQQPVTLTGTLADTALVFNNTVAAIADHYYKTEPQEMQFKNSTLNLVKSRDTVYLSGSLSLYSPKWHETQRPEFIMLIRTSDRQNNLVNEQPDTAKISGKQNSLTTMHSDTARADSLHFVAYPNPFSTRLQLRYTLTKAANVSILVSDLLSGRIVYRTEARQAAVGDHTDPVSFNGAPGNYVVTLLYGKKLKSAVVFKQ